MKHKRIAQLVSIIGKALVLKLNFPAVLHCMSVLKLFQLLIINFIMIFIADLIGGCGLSWSEVGSYELIILIVSSKPIDI